MKSKTLKPKLNSIVITPEHPDRQHFKVLFKGRRVHCTGVQLLVIDGSYFAEELSAVDLGFELVE